MNNNIVIPNRDNGESIFKKSSKIQRSPERTVVSMINASTHGKENPSSFDKLGVKIEKLVEFLKGRNNIHKEIASLSKEIQAIYMITKQDGSNRVAPPSSTIAEKIFASQETQTEKLFVAQANKRKNSERSSNAENNEEPPVKKRYEAHKPPKENKKKIGNDIPKTKEWIKVDKKRRNKPKKRSQRPDALIIKSCANMSYADILKKVKSDGKLSNLGENVKGIRKTEKGELLVELNKAEHENLHQFEEVMKEVLGSDAEVRSLTHEIILQIKDIDEVTSKEEIIDALRKSSDSMKDLHCNSLKSLRPAYGSTQIATICLSAHLANNLLDAGKIKIGWVVCRIRQKITPKKCFKCLDFGHIAAHCKSSNDFSKCCIKCGEAGHKIQDCSKAPKCLLCTNEKQTANHITGSVICPKYKMAVEHLKRST